jgi:hypothetical protein
MHGLCRAFVFLPDEESMKNGAAIRASPSLTSPGMAGLTRSRGDAEVHLGISASPPLRASSAMLEGTRLAADRRAPFFDEPLDQENPVMRKLTLDFDALTVDSFATSAEKGDGVGTIHAREWQRTVPLTCDQTLLATNPTCCPCTP